MRHVAHIFRRHAKPERRAPQYSYIHFTSNLDWCWAIRRGKTGIDRLPHADSHFEYAKRAGSG